MTRIFFQTSKQNLLWSSIQNTRLTILASKQQKRVSSESGKFILYEPWNHKLWTKNSNFWLLTKQILVIFQQYFKCQEVLFSAQNLLWLNLEQIKNCLSDIIQRNQRRNQTQTFPTVLVVTYKYDQEQLHCFAMSCNSSQSRYLAREGNNLSAISTFQVMFIIWILFEKEKRTWNEDNKFLYHLTPEIVATCILTQDEDVAFKKTFFVLWSGQEWFLIHTYYRSSLFQNKDQVSVIQYFPQLLSRSASCDKLISIELFQSI